MATIFRCDKCAKEFTEINKVQSFTVYEVDYSKRNFKDDDTTRKIDLCASCTGRLFDWLKPDPKEAVTTNPPREERQRAALGEL